MGDDVSSDSDDSGDDNGGTDARATPVGPMPAPVPTEVLHAMPTQGRLVHDLPEEDTPYDSWGRISEAQQYVPPPPYTATELMLMREANLPFSVVPNYRDVSMVHMAVYDTGLQLSSHSLYNHKDGGILRKGMVFRTMAEMKLFLQDYAVWHHRPYRVTHSDKGERYQCACIHWTCPWVFHAWKKKSDGRWRVTKVEQPHTCRDNSSKHSHPQLTARYLARRILGCVDADNNVSVSMLQQNIYTFTGYEVKYGKAWHAKQIALAIRWGSWEEAYNRVPRILCAMRYYNPGMRWFIDTGGMYLWAVQRHVLFRVFWYFAQTQHAFQYYRPVILVDAHSLQESIGAP
jgi:NAD-dependent dihydropyrimidine dehydrogenase PreA subunit